MKKKVIIICLLIIGTIGYLVLDYLRIIPRKVYYAKDFNIIKVKSTLDANNNGIDDYHDIMLGARKDADNAPTYYSTYYQGGYPPKEDGVCTDVIWRAFLNAGYNLKDMVDIDIKNNIQFYPRVQGKADPNIDFRRVPNLFVFSLVMRRF